MISSSRSSPTNTQTSSTHVQNLNLQDTEGVTIANSSGVEIIQTDQGAIAAALDVGKEALQVGERSLVDAGDLAGRGLENALKFASGSQIEAFGFGGKVLDLARDVFTESVSANAQLAAANQSGLQSLAQKNAESADDRVTRVSGYALLAVVILALLPVGLQFLRNRA